MGVARRDFLKWLGLAPLAAAATVYLQSREGIGETVPHSASTALAEEEAWRKWVGESAREHVRDLDQGLVNCTFSGTKAQVDRHRYQALGSYQTKPEGTPVQFDSPGEVGAWSTRLPDGSLVTVKTRPWEPRGRDRYGANQPHG